MNTAIDEGGGACEEIDECIVQRSVPIQTVTQMADDQVVASCTANLPDMKTMSGGNGGDGWCV
ncbi:hypothetical protein GN244_ATG16800 [Phytophthora infestans]|uniref:Uncharacterized protein n=1 Tax=Phytophthora infestans TaxID=4787 RepID=A0A833SPQ6_PHYIN|nr:hypothetical protein GN244_ATG16800 [Phytophthora infestans]KAF4134192.1 hypothetical protein GN958_ATG16667 [Phytophthora infestans]KAF4148198.1 hypothetical protein GN958_ATG02611 [Phytophthora infestans]